MLGIVRWLEIVWCNLEGIQTSFKKSLPALFWRWDGLKVQIGIYNFGKQCVHFNTVHFNTSSQKTSSVNASNGIHNWTSSWLSKWSAQPPVFPKTNWKGLPKILQTAGFHNWIWLQFEPSYWRIDRTKNRVVMVGLYANRKNNTWIFQVCKMCAEIHQNTLPKGRNYISI